MKFIKSFIKKEEVKKSETEEINNKNQSIDDGIPGCRFPTDPIEEDFYISQVLGI